MNERPEATDGAVPTLTYFDVRGRAEVIRLILEEVGHPYRERRIQLSKQAVRPPGNARGDLEIVIELSERIGLRTPFRTAAEVMDEIARVTPSWRGVSHARLDGGPGLQYPVHDHEHPGTSFLFDDAFPTADGKATFAAVEFLPPAELPDDDFHLSRGQLGIHGVGRSAADTSGDADHELRAQTFRLTHQRLVVLVEDHLRDARAIPDVDEQQSSQVANAVHPAEQHDFRADVVRAECAAGVCPCQFAELFSHVP